MDRQAEKISGVRYGAVIVAAGMSTRMKDFKQLMKVGQMSLSERVIANFKKAGVPDIVMVTGYKAKELERSLKNTGIIFLKNEQYETTQMFDSARIGLEYLKDRCGRVFFCPVDVPFFTDETLRREMEADADVVVPVHEGEDGHPLLLDAGILPEILAYKGGGGLKRAYEALPAGSIVRVEVDDEGAILDADTQEDYQRLVALHNRRIMRPDIRLRFCGTKPFFGPGTVRLLRQIDALGSVREACRTCGMSYSKGWSILRDCEETLGKRIVDRQPGGENGGAASVTEEGHRLIRMFEEIEAELDRIAKKRFEELFYETDTSGDAGYRRHQ